MDAFSFSSLFSSTAFCVCAFVLLFSRLLPRSNSISMYRTHVKITFHEQTVWNLWLERIFSLKRQVQFSIVCVRVCFISYSRFLFGGWVISVQHQRRSRRRHTFNQLCKCKCKCMNEWDSSNSCFYVHELESASNEKLNKKNDSKVNANVLRHEWMSLSARVPVDAQTL